MLLMHVALVMHEKGCIRLACRDTVCSLAGDLHELQDDTVWYLVDAVDPLPASAKTVVTASFNSGVTKVSNITIRSSAWHTPDTP